MRIIDLKNIKGIIYSKGSYSDRKISLTTDSRGIKEQNVFLALVGENFDGFNYVTSVLESGVEVVIYTDAPGREEKVETLQKSYPHILFIAVKNSLEYLQDCASWWVRKWQDDFGGKVFGLTGSNGKTTTKELLFSFAKEVFGEKVMCTAGNFNNHIGVPLTIFNIQEHHEFAIIEMGTNHHGEIGALCEIANPNYGFITNIGSAHIEFLGDEEGVLKEKSALYRYINKHGGKFYLNLRDKYLKSLEVTKETIAFGESEDFLNELKNDYLSEDYNIWNFKSAFYILCDLCPAEREKLLKISPSVRLPENKRSQWVTQGDQKIFLDAYNANPSSMSFAISSFAKNVQGKGKALYVLGDMNELGAQASKYHQDIAKQLNDLNVQDAIFVGKFAQDYKSSFSGNGLAFETTAQLKAEWNKVSNSYQYIFLKASRTLQLESLLDITDR